ncbi:uncharacterized protein (TIGR02444 family) [Phyllobacterium trifolii]|uniref:Uncharacterized protein (TIGR02444 family) n=1 Tax=Phyllobacterium trifolii TaxID=300193 RepID=A0A839UHX5_9HYPH|nr:TIGR02444 family protein [Phyllobacterium trifolii]MBB3148470.1 uncharacterized protein (TIGR02444 family) [Phyllobacterium trifolii]
MAQMIAERLKFSNGGGDLLSFALGIYGDEAVRTSCLHLQDSVDADVNVILWGAWMSSVRHVHVDAALAASAAARVSACHRDIVRNLRAVRVLLKHQAHASMGEQAVRLRETIKTVEIESEIIELNALAEFSRDLAGVPGTVPRTAEDIGLSIWAAAVGGSAHRADGNDRRAVEAIALAGMTWSAKLATHNISGDV